MHFSSTPNPNQNPQISRVLLASWWTSGGSLSEPPRTALFSALLRSNANAFVPSRSSPAFSDQLAEVPKRGSSMPHSTVGVGGSFERRGEERFVWATVGGPSDGRLLWYLGQKMFRTCVFGFSLNVWKVQFCWLKEHMNQDRLSRMPNMLLHVDLFVDQEHPLGAFKKSGRFGWF